MTRIEPIILEVYSDTAKRVISHMHSTELRVAAMSSKDNMSAVSAYVHVLWMYFNKNLSSILEVRIKMCELKFEAR